MIVDKLEQKKVTLETKVGVSSQNIQWHFKGNMDTCIKKMMPIPLQLNERQVLQLKCCLLFICGMPFSQIASLLDIAQGTISNYLNDEKMEELLRFEYKVLFQMNKCRLNPESTNKKIIRAVTIFIEQDGNYQKTSSLTGFSERTLSRYFSNPNLEEILNDSFAYQKFLTIMEKHIMEIKEEASRNSIRKQQIQDTLMSLHPTSIVESRYFCLCHAILIDGICDIRELSKVTNLSKANIDSYLRDYSKNKNFLPEMILDALSEKAKIIYAKEDEMSKDVLSEEEEKAIIAFYMNGRYSYGDMEEILGSRYYTKKLLLQRAKQLLSEEELLALKQHKIEVEKLLTGCPRNKYLIKEAKMISSVKPEIIYVDVVDFKLLSSAVGFLTNYQRILLEELEPPMLSVVSGLFFKMTRLEQLLQEDAFYKLQKYLSIEQLLLGNDLQKQSDLIMSVVRKFFSNHLDLDITSVDLEIEVESLIRILQSKFIEACYGEVVHEYIRKAIATYRENGQNKKAEEKRYCYLRH